jgi:lysophospholipase L1-like esterase
VRFLALGDSYTCGEGVAVADRWPNQLARMLRERSIDVADPEIIARTAWTTDELSDAIDESKPQGPYDLVTLMVGVNDQYRSRPVAPFANEFKRLLRRAKTFAGNKSKRVIVLSIPDWGATPYAGSRNRDAIGQEIQAFNDAARTLTEAARMRWVDVTTESRAMLGDPSLAVADGLHPSGEMYRRWAKLLVPIVEAFL